MSNIYKLAYKFLCNAITYSYNIRTIDIISSMSSKSLAKEYATIKLCLPRKSGHTNLAIDLINNFLYKPAYIVPNKTMLEQYIKNINPEDRYWATIDKLDRFNGILAGSVIVDGISLMSINQIEKIYNKFLPQLKKKPSIFTYIFLE